MRSYRYGHSWILCFGIVTYFLLSFVNGSYDSPGYGAIPDHSHYAHGGGGGGHNAGSYYHYHVPVVGQQHHPQPHHHQSDHHYLIPLLLLGIPLLLAPLLLPLLLIPLGLSLLALLMPGGMMMMMMMMMPMMMMMMMMMPQLPNPLGIRNENVGRAMNEMRTLGDIVLNDISGLMAKYSRSLDLDKCPQRLACEVGSFVIPVNSTQISTARTLTSYLVEQAVPKGKARKFLKQVEKAFWLGSSGSGQCNIFNCQPAFRIYQQQQQQQHDTSYSSGGTINEAQHPELNEARATKTTKLKFRKKIKNLQQENNGYKKPEDENNNNNNNNSENQHEGVKFEYVTDATPQQDDNIGKPKPNYWQPHSFQGFDTVGVSPTTNYDSLPHPIINS